MTTKINTAWGTKSITTSAAIDKTTQFVPTNTDGTAWRTNGKITLDSETMDIVQHMNFPLTGTLQAPIKDDKQDAAIFDTNQWEKGEGGGWGYVDNKEIISWQAQFRIDASTTLTQELKKEAKDNVLKVKNASGFYSMYKKYKMYLHVDWEIMRVVDIDVDGKTIKVERAQFKSDLAAHEVNMKVKQPRLLVGVQRGLAGTAKAVHLPGVTITTKVGFLVGPRGAGGKDHAMGTKINYMYSDAQHKAQIRSTFAHECGHSCFLNHYDDEPCIMKTKLEAGSIDGNGINHAYAWQTLRLIKVSNK